MGQTSGDLAGMDFKAIYHDGSVGVLGTPGRSDILFARLAEVLVPDRLPFDRLKFIACRSEAERDTLLALLNRNVRKRWISKVVVDKGHRRLFYKQGTFVQSAHLTEQEARFAFYHYISREMLGPFSVRVEWVSRNKRWAQDYRDFMVGGDPVVFPIPGDVDLGDYWVQLSLNGDTAYIGHFDSRAADVF